MVLKTDPLPRRIVRPRSLEALAATVRQARREGRRVRPMGGGHTLSAIATTPDLLVRTDGLARRLPLHDGLRRSADPDGLVAVEAGLEVRRLAALLAREGRMLDNLAAFTRQTVAGAMATASHGTGLRLPPMCDQVESMIVVTAGGELVRLEPADGPTDPARHREPGVTLVQDDERFHATLTGLGALGIVGRLTLRTRPAVALRETRTVGPVDEVLQRLKAPGALDGARHLQVLFNLYGAGGPPLACLTERRVADPPAIVDRLRPRQRLGPSLGSHLPTRRLVLPMLRACPALAPWLVDRALRSTVRGPLTKASHRILDNHPLNTCARAYAFEAFVPLGRWPDAVAALRALAGRRAADARPHWLSAPVSLRFVGPSRHLLAPSLGEGGAMIEVINLVGAPGGREALRPYAELLAGYGGRQHLGLDIVGVDGADDFARRYPELPRLRALRRDLDPERRFASPFLDHLGITS